MSKQPEMRPSLADLLKSSAPAPWRAVQHEVFKDWRVFAYNDMEVARKIDRRDAELIAAMRNFFHAGLAEDCLSLLQGDIQGAAQQEALKRDLGNSLYAAHSATHDAE